MKIKTVLVIDDGSAEQEAVLAYFKAISIFGIRTANLTEAMQALKEVKVDLVILDIEVNSRYDNRLLEELQAGYPALPVVLVSGLSRKPLLNVEVKAVYGQTLEFSNFKKVLSGFGGPPSG